MLESKVYGEVALQQPSSSCITQITGEYRMFVIRFIVLAFLVAYGFGMSGISPRNGFGELVVFSLLFSVPALYFLPTFEAWNKRHPNLTAIALINAFLGWSLIGWVISIVWAFKKSEVTATPSRVVELDTKAMQPERRTKKCPFCAEEILAEAIKCKHCQSDLSTAKS